MGHYSGELFLTHDNKKGRYMWKQAPNKIENLLEKAAAMGDIESIKKLDGNLDNAMKSAVIYGQVKSIEALLSRGANIQGEAGVNLLKSAIMYNS